MSGRLVQPISRTVSGGPQPLPSAAEAAKIAGLGGAAEAAPFRKMFHDAAKSAPFRNICLKALLISAVLIAAMLGCGQHKAASNGPKATAFGSALVEVGGGKQVAAAGSTLDQPVVVQVNDAQGNAVTGAAVSFHGPAGVVFSPAAGLTDSNGQVSTVVALGGVGARYQITATARDSSGKAIELKLDEIALGYQQTLGRQLNRQYCARCHDPESTPERVSNYDNLATKPHAFTEGDALNKMTDADLTAIISHGGPALNRSPEMPAYGYTLSKTEIQALIAYIRAVADPPYKAAGVVYAKN